MKKVVASPCKIVPLSNWRCARETNYVPLRFTRRNARKKSRFNKYTLAKAFGIFFSIMICILINSQLIVWETINCLHCLVSALFSNEKGVISLNKLTLCNSIFLLIRRIKFCNREMENMHIIIHKQSIFINILHFALPQIRVRRETRDSCRKRCNYNAVGNRGKRFLLQSFSRCREGWIERGLIRIPWIRFWDNTRSWYGTVAWSSKQCWTFSVRA